MTGTPEVVPAVQEKPAEIPETTATTIEDKKPEELKSATSDAVFSMFGGGAQRPKREEQDDADEPKGNKGTGEVCPF